MEEIIDMQMPVLLCAILLIVISIPLYFGKGSNMIAGYNDLSQADKKINKMRLCRTLAITLDITAIILILGAYSIISINDFRCYPTNCRSCIEQCCFQK